MVPEDISKFYRSRTLPHNPVFPPGGRGTSERPLDSHRHKPGRWHFGNVFSIIAKYNIHNISGPWFDGGKELLLYMNSGMYRPLGELFMGYLPRCLYTNRIGAEIIWWFIGPRMKYDFYIHFVLNGGKWVSVHHFYRRRFFEVLEFLGIFKNKI